MQHRNPPPEPRFDWGRDADRAQGSFGNHLLKAGINAVLKKPSYTAGETVVRPFPSLSYQDVNQFEPYRKNAQLDSRFGNWIRKYDCAWSVGQGPQRKTFLTHDPGSGKPYDPDGTPLNILYNAIYQAKKREEDIRRNPNFVMLFERERDAGPPLERTKTVYLIQGMVILSDGKPTYSHDRPPLGGGGPTSPSCIFMISGGSPMGSFSAGNQLCSQLNEERLDYQGPADDFEARYVHGDPVAPEHGRFFHFRKSGTAVTAPGAGPGGPAGWRAAPAVQQAVQGGRQQALQGGYDVWVSNGPLFDNSTPYMGSAEDLEMIRQKWIYWEDALHFPDYEEQAYYLNQVFPPNAIVYAFQGAKRHWISDETWRAFNGSVTAQALTPDAVRQPQFAPPTAQQGAPAGGGQGWRGASAAPLQQPPVARASQPQVAPQKQQAAPGQMDMQAELDRLRALVRQGQTQVAAAEASVLRGPRAQELVDFPPRDDMPASPLDTVMGGDEPTVYQAGQPVQIGGHVGHPDGRQLAVDPVVPRGGMPDEPAPVEGDNSAPVFSRLADMLRQRRGEQQPPK
ncbi:MAG: hypothetical protein E6G97_18580 [Alphaproteobacteria bacterium]|nr:MAG: hypothetical protein E6G97_18580 [Alphaproteobacteria bacterium]